MPSTDIYKGDCLKELGRIEENSVDLVYLDPPFFTQKVQKLSTRDGISEFSFNDIWTDHKDYAEFLLKRLAMMRKCLKETGSIFFHCDKSASHIVRLLLDNVFGTDNFQSEIIWSYKRWSNSKKGLLPAHQTIFFYSKTENFKFNRSYQDYSLTTNVDQIMQKRVRDSRNKSAYARNNNGDIISNGSKKGVPLSDVWEIPYLNPKAKERVGYPTQKPIILLEKIIQLVTDIDDIVLDPFCGSGTTLIAAQILSRSAIGIDVSDEAIQLTKKRLSEGTVTRSALLENGKESYKQHSVYVENILHGLDYTPVQRNKGIDGLLKQEIEGLPAFIRVQRPHETIFEAATLLKKSSRNKGDCKLLVVQTTSDILDSPSDIKDVIIVPSTAYALKSFLKAHAETTPILTSQHAQNH